MEHRPWPPGKTSDVPDQGDDSLPEVQDSLRLNINHVERLEQVLVMILPLFAQMEEIKQNKYESLRQVYDALDDVDRSYKEQKEIILQTLCGPSCSLNARILAQNVGAWVGKERDAVLNHHEVSMATTMKEGTGEAIKLPLYLPLDIRKREIRLLRLLPGDKSTKPCCEMFEASMDEKPEYFALSYTWGDQSVTSTVSVNGHEVSVTGNLEVALRNLRHEDDAMTIWIDALCINQQDLVEKGRQIMQMWHVYSQAKCTLIWLGESSDDSDLAMDFVRTVNEADFNDPEVQLDPTIWKAVDRLLHRSWWSRVWIIQEAVASTNAIVKCGRKEAHFNSFMTISKIANRRVASVKGTFASPILPCCPLLCMIYDVEDQPKEASSLEPWIIRAHDFKSSDPRDKIYALLGFATAEERDAIPPDYTKPLDQIQLEVSAHLLIESKRLITLQRGRGPSSVGLPTWVRLGSSEQSYTPMIFPAAGRTPYSASANTIIHPVLSSDLKTITLCGSTFDTIAFVSPRVMPKALFESLWPLTCQVWESCVEVFQAKYGNPYANTCGKAEAFWRTLILDRLVDWSGPPPSAFGQLFEVSTGCAQVPEEYVKSCKTASNDDIRARYLYPFHRSILAHLSGRSFFITGKGYMGLVATIDGAEEGDLICLLAGGEVPFILRSKGESLYQFIGESYVHGIMDGSAWNDSRPLPVGVKQGKEDGWEEFCII